MRRKIYAIFAALALVAMMPMYASCSQCKKKENDRSSITSCLCALASKKDHRRRRVRTVVYVQNPTTSTADTSACIPDGTLDCPYLTIAAGIASGADIVYVIATGTPYIIHEPLILHPGQALIGSTIALEVKGKKSPALTATKPLIRVKKDAETGIVIANKCVVAGLDIRGADISVGIVSDPIHECTIENNNFQSMTGGINLELATANGTAGVNISGNTLHTLAEGIVLHANAGAKAKIVQNIFTHVAEGISGLPLTIGGKAVAKPAKRTSLSTSNASFGYELLIERNTLTVHDIPTTFGIGVSGASKLTILENLVSHYQAGMSVGNVPSGAVLSVEGNTFDKIIAGNGAEGYQNMVFLNNLFRCHRDAGNIASLALSLGEAATACVQGNTFTHSTGDGFSVVTASANAQSLPCLQLANNLAENNDGMDLVLNPSSGSLQINNNWNAFGVNTYGTESHDNLSPVDSCSNCLFLE